MDVVPDAEGWYNLTMSLCKIGEILADTTKNSPEESQALTKALNARTQDGKFVWSAKELSNRIKKTRFSVGATTIKEHRREDCGCFQ